MDVFSLNSRNKLLKLFLKSLFFSAWIANVSFFIHWLLFCWLMAHQKFHPKKTWYELWYSPIQICLLWIVCIRMTWMTVLWYNLHAYWSSDNLRSTHDLKKSSSRFWRLLNKSADFSKPWGRFFQILFVSQNVRTLTDNWYCRFSIITKILVTADIRNLYFMNLSLTFRVRVKHALARPRTPSHALACPHMPSVLLHPKPHTLSWLWDPQAHCSKGGSNVKIGFHDS